MNLKLKQWNMIDMRETFKMAHLFYVDLYFVLFIYIDIIVTVLKVTFK